MLAASISEMQYWHFLTAIFAGRFLRFLLLALLTIKFGPDIVRVTGSVFKTHWQWVLGAVLIGLVIWLAIRAFRKKTVTAAAAKDSQRTA